MLSRDLLRERPDEGKARLTDRGVDLELVDPWPQLHTERRSLLLDAQTLKQRRNEASKRIRQKKRTRADANEETLAVGTLKERIEQLDQRLNELDGSLQHIDLRFPN